MDLAENKKRWDNLVNPAMQYAKKGNYRKAIKLLEKVCLENSDDKDFYYSCQIQIAVILGVHGKEKEAILKFRSIPKYGDETIYLEAQRWLGDFFISKKRWEDLEELYLELEGRELVPTLRIMLSGFLFELKRYNEAIDLLEPITRDDGHSYFTAKTNQMVIAMKSKDYNKVIDLSEMLYPEDDLVLYDKSRLLLADALIKLNKKSDAFNVLVKIEKSKDEPRLYSEAQSLLWCKFPIKTLRYKLKL